MERALKERLAGAVVLVLAGVLFIPMLLGGREQATPVSTPLALPEPVEAQTRQHTFELDGTPQPVPRVESDAANIPRASVEGIVPEARQSDPPAAAPPLPDATEAVRAMPAAAWAVQVGSFANRENAERLVGALQQRGHPAFVARHEAEGRTRYRVRVGPETTRELAEQLAMRLRAEGEQTSLVPPE